MRALTVLLATSFTFGCADDGGDDAGDLGLGDLSGDDLKADGNWGAATTCKPVPALPTLAQPEIFISLDGLTLRLVDRASGFEKVFPVGVGAIDKNPSSLTFGESLTYFPLASRATQDFVITPSTIQPCKVWWTDPANGAKLPVFAGLPFLSWSGNYGIHGPIDNYRAANGGNLRRGYVSHGCIRMEADGVLEVYARIKGAASVPVHVQREPERTADDTRVDVSATWIGAECEQDDDCAYDGGICKTNPWSERGFCTASCTSSCADRAGQPTTFCVADPDAPGEGMCVPRHSAVNSDCRPYDHFVARTAPRFGSTSASQSVCVPGSRGWVGDRCLANADCDEGTTCTSGVCTMTCTRLCPDQPGYADTFCVADASLGQGGHCARTCTPASNAAECPAETTCEARGNAAQPSVVKHVCLPD